MPDEAELAAERREQARVERPHGTGAADRRFLAVDDHEVTGLRIGVGRDVRHHPTAVGVERRPGRGAVVDLPLRHGEDVGKAAAGSLAVGLAVAPDCLLGAAEFGGAAAADDVRARGRHVHVGPGIAVPRRIVAGGREHDQPAFRGLGDGVFQRLSGPGGTLSHRFSSAPQLIDSTSQPAATAALTTASNEANWLGAQNILIVGIVPVA